MNTQDGWFQTINEYTANVESPIEIQNASDFLASVYLRKITIFSMYTDRR